METVLLSGFAFAVASLGYVVLRRTLLRPGRRVRRALNSMEVTPIEHLREGDVVKVFGVIEAGSESMRAPLSGRACIGYQIVHTTHDEGLESDSVELERCAEFIMKDSTGAIRVDTRSVGLTFDEFDVQSEEPPDALKAQRTEGSAWSPASVRYSEAVLIVGTRVAVIGRAQSESDPDAARWDGYRSSPRRFALSAPEGGHLLVGTARGQDG